MSDVKVRIVRSDGKELILNDGKKWRLPKDALENFANLPYSVSSIEYPSEDGGLVVSKRVASVDRSIRAVAQDWHDNEALRAEAIAFFNPKFTFDVHVSYMGRTRWCNGEQIGFKCSEGNIYEPSEFEWSILCANPFLQSESNFGKNIAEIIPKFGFPFMSFLPVSDGSVPGCNTGFLASVHSFEQEVNILNSGDVETRMKIELRVHTGFMGHESKVVNPIIKIGDGFIRVPITMTEDDVLSIDATTRPPRVELNGENILNKVDRKSNLLGLILDVGETLVEYDADDGYENMSVTVYYNNQFLGL